ncbi:MAG: hypothetical protein Q8Q33_05690 [Chlamydiota bacterium]|nr:hypothetical protein [Chlamydiota bacterium]
MSSNNKKKRIGILNKGKNNQFISNTFENLDIGIQDEGENTIAKGNKFLSSFKFPTGINWTKWEVIIGGIGVLVAIYFGIMATQNTEKLEAYTSTQTVYENKPTTPYEYLDLDGRGQLAPLLFETIVAAAQFGEAKGEENKIYMHRVVVMALDPSVRYTEGDVLGDTFKPAYDPDKLYTFYLPDGTDITDENTSINIIPAGDKIYEVKLLSIDGRKDEQGRMSYTFKVEEVVE